MTHEHHASEWSEIGGPEQDDKLPDAASIPVYENPEDSFAPLMEHDLDDGEGRGLFDILPPRED